MHELTGDFYAVSKILGHSLKGTGIQLGLSGNLDSVTARYVDVRTDQHEFVPDTYHSMLFPNLRKKNQGESTTLETKETRSETER